MLSPVAILTMVLSIMTKFLNSKLVIMLEYQNVKIFSLRHTLQFGMMKYGHTLLVILKW